MTSLEIARTAFEVLREHAVTSYPDECCGALLGTAGADRARVVVTLPLPNTTAEGARRRFLVRPQDYREAEMRARQIGADLIGFYHSHPDNPASPSTYDLQHAWPNLSYVIIGVEGSRPGEARSWRLRADRSAFDEERISLPWQHQS